MKKYRFIKVTLMLGLIILLSGANETVYSQDDYEGQFVFKSVTVGNEYNAPDFIALSKYDGDKATVYRQRTGGWGITGDMREVSAGVFEYGFGRDGISDKTKGERIKFLSLNKLVYENTFRGVKAIFVRKQK